MRQIVLLCMLTMLANGMRGQCVVSVSPSSVNTCPGDSMAVTVSGGTSYSWSPSFGLSCTTCPNPMVYVDSSVTYTVSSSTSGSQNAVNWNFSSGNSGFGTQYIYSPTSIWNEGTYAVGSSANAVHPNFAAWGDHTTGTGNYMIINGSTSGIKTIWSQTVALPAGSSATLSLWMLTLATPAGQFRVKINGTVIGSNQTTPTTVGVWGNYTFPFTVPASGNAVVLIESVSTLLAGNDFGLDDIQFTYSCTASASLNVQPYPVPLARGVASKTLGCPGICVQWADSSLVNAPGQIVWRQWDWADGSQDTGRFPVHCYQNEGSYAGSLTVVTNHGCRSSVPLQSIQVSPAPSLTLGFDSTAGCVIDPLSGQLMVLPPIIDPNALGSCYHFTVQAPGWGSQFPDSSQVTISFKPMGIQPSSQVWNLNSSQLLSTWFNGPIPNQFSQRPEEICFYLRFPGGCGDSICFPLRVIPQVEMPNVFTPNGDGVNDVFIPKFTNADWAEWSIINRWGQEVFRSQSVTEAWDGYIRGKAAADGVYFVLVRSGNSDVPQVAVIHGTIHLMR